ncbi:MAG TPA: hypothetical protein VIC06_00380 [Solirubrobacteraceae bacterium]|jgi:hypothetical protein
MQDPALSATESFRLDLVRLKFQRTTNEILGAGTADARIAAVQPALGTFKQESEVALKLVQGEMQMMLIIAEVGYWRPVREPEEGSATDRTVPAHIPMAHLPVPLPGDLGMHELRHESRRTDSSVGHPDGSHDRQLLLAPIMGGSIGETEGAIVLFGKRPFAWTSAECMHLATAAAQIDGLLIGLKVSLRDVVEPAVAQFAVGEEAVRETAIEHDSIEIRNG